MASKSSKQKKSHCTPTNPCLLLRKLVDLMEHPISKNTTERHLQLLNQFLNASHYAFFLQDISYIIRLYEMIAQRIENTPQFFEPLQCLLCFSAVPPMCTKISDQMEYSRDFQEYLSVLGYLILCLRDEDLCRSVINAIRGLLEKKSAGYCCVPHEYIQNAVEKSKLPEILAQLIAVISDNLYPLLLEITLLTCEISKISCKMMVRGNAVEFLLRRLEPKWRERNGDSTVMNPTTEENIIHLENTCCILWYLLNFVENKEEKRLTNLAMCGLQHALRWSLVCPGHRKDRNNLTAIILKILDTFRDVDFAEIVESKLLHDLALLAVTASDQVNNADIYFTQDDVDFQFKKITWTCLYYFSGEHFKCGFEIVEEYEIIKILLKYLFGDQINHVHYCSLVKIVIKLIPRILNISPNNFLLFNGPLQITKMIKNYTNTTYNIEILEAYVYCVHKCLLLQNESITQAFIEALIFSAVTNVCQKILETEILIKIHQKCLSRCFCLLRLISDADFSYYNLIVDLCVNYFNRLIHSNENLDIKLTISALFLLWNGVSRVNSVHTEFVKKGGTYIMLDIAEMGTFPVKSMALGILADLSKRSLCIPYLITWRKRGLKLLSMLMEIFRGQTEISCSEKTQFSDEIINNPRITLCRGKNTNIQKYCLTQKDILKNCRTKIHGILQAVKVKFKDKVEIANQFYKLYSEKISTDDKLTMLFADNFISLTMCQCWIGIAKEIKKEKIIPTEPDLEFLIDRIERIRQWKSYLQFKIENIVQKEMQQNLNEEYETYMQLNEARLSDALDALKELRFVSNCTERMFQVTKNFRVSQQIEPRQSQEGANYHKTLVNLPLVNIFDQTVNIDSNIVYRKKEEIDIFPVSPDQSVDYEIEYSDETLSERILEC